MSDRNPTLGFLNLAEQLVPDWTVSFRATIEGKDDDFVDDAHVTLEREARTALIRYNHALDDTTLFVLFRHELIHILLADMSFVGCNGRSIEIMELYNLFEERVCNKLAQVL